MELIERYLSIALNFIFSMSFDLLAICLVGAYIAVYLVFFVVTLTVERVKRADRAPFLFITNAFTALVLATTAKAFSAEECVAITAVFWFSGYLLYGSLCLLPKGKIKPQVATATISSMPSKPPQMRAYTGLPTARCNVRLDHAFSITEKLLLKDLGKGDRSEVEKIKTTLSVFKTKEELSSPESEVLNDCFNALLKLMAKYEV